MYGGIWVGESVCYFAIRNATELHDGLGLETNECGGQRLVPESESHWKRWHVLVWFEWHLQPMQYDCAISIDSVRVDDTSRASYVPSSLPFCYQVNPSPQIGLPHTTLEIQPLSKP